MHELISAGHVVALTGAGISAESGIPTFRGEGSDPRRGNPAVSASIANFRRDPAAYWAVSRERGRTALQAKPNAAHVALAELERAGLVDAVITQNTDRLHLDAGSRRLIELHGNGRQVECLDCGARESRADVQARLETEMPPRCRMCGGAYLKPTVVLFGEPLPADALRGAVALAQACRTMLVVGSSLVVQPAAQLPLIAHDHGADVVIVNREPTPLDRIATSVIRRRAAEFLPDLVHLAGASRRPR